LGVVAFAVVVGVVDVGGGGCRGVDIVADVAVYHQHGNACYQPLLDCCYVNDDCFVSPGPSIVLHAVCSIHLAHCCR
jgi:hypothetical protein